MNKYIPLLVLVVIIVVGGFLYLQPPPFSSTYPPYAETNQGGSITSTYQTQPTPSPNPLMILEMRKREYPGSEVTIERTVAQMPSYTQYYASHLSDGLKIFGLLTVPKGEVPPGGFPVIMFNHGYIAPEVYRTTERYVAYQDTFARNGYITFKSDYRGHDKSEGIPAGGHFAPDYTVDVLNGISSMKKLQDPLNRAGQPVANPDKIGMWGHSMGGSITQRAMVVSKDIKAGVIWAGVVGGYPEQVRSWYSRRTFNPSPREQRAGRIGIQEAVKMWGNPDDNSPFWTQVSPVSYLQDISGPVQLHHGTNDEDVPQALSEDLKRRMDEAGKPAEIYLYQGGDHNISSPHFSAAIQRSLEFFDRYLKG